MAVAIAWLPGPAGTRRRVAKLSVEEPDAAEPARPDLWGARVSNDTLVYPTPSVLHCTEQYANNRAEVSHQPTRQRERQMRRFKSAAQLQRFASVHGIVQNLFRVGRHLLRSAHHRLLRTRAFVEWDAVTCAC